MSCEYPCKLYVALKANALLSASVLAIGLVSSSNLYAQETKPAATGASSPSQLPAVEVEAPARVSQPRKATAGKRADAVPVRRRQRDRVSTAPVPRANVPAPAGPLTSPLGPSQDARSGTVGVYTNSTSVATKTNTPLVNIPQSITVVNKNQIKDRAAQSIGDVIQYVPGVMLQQGEGNRDQLAIRGVDTSANFFVNGFRDDVQYYRDLYNAQSLEVIKGPSALTFGRGSGGGLVNRTLKEADGVRVYDVTGQTGSYANRRFTLDAGQAINDSFAARVNMMYEKSDTFRDFGQLQRHGINPTVTLLPGNRTKIKLSYEYFHDWRITDRGNPSQGRSPAATRFDPASPFLPNGDRSTFYGSPDFSFSRADVQSGIATIEHDFGSGLSVKNGTIYANYRKFYSNVYPGGAVSPDQRTVNLAAYEQSTNRQNLINQTDLIWKVNTGPLFHTAAFGTEFARQTGGLKRNSGVFPNGTATTPVDPFNPTYLGGVNFIHQVPGSFAPGYSTPDNDSLYGLNVQSVYARDTIDVSSWLQVIGGARFDRFDLGTTDFNTLTRRTRVDNNVSPQAALILKPMANLSIYGAYSVSFLPASGDQFSTLTNGTLILQPQRFENKEIGVKWNVLPQLIYTAAAFDMRQSNVPLPDPNNPGFFILSGNNKIRGFETALNGYVTDAWQSTLGYSYTDPRINSDLSSTIVTGNRIGIVPISQVSLWNKYQLTPHWGAGGGLIYFSDFFASADNTVKIPGFVRFDAAVFLKVNERIRAQLNVENVFDRTYFATAHANNNISPGQPRTFRLIATASF